jgi:hypothetical protein
LPFKKILKYFQAKLEDQNDKFKSLSGENKSLVEQLTKKIEGYEGYFLFLFYISNNILLFWLTVPSTT